MPSTGAIVQLATWNDWGEGAGIEPTEEFGYRDLEVVQRLRRELVDAEFSFKPDDLRLVHQLLLLRRQQANRLRLEIELDKIAQLLSKGSVSEARAKLKQLDSGAR